MGQPIEITRTELSASALRVIAGKTDDGAVVRRLLAVALVLEGRSRTEAALLNGMTVRRCATGFITTTPKAWKDFDRGAVRDGRLF